MSTPNAGEAVAAALAERARPLIAVSGGADSLALLWLAQAARPGAIAAATVDHGLRPAAAEEAAQVARLCTTIGVGHATLEVRTDRDGRGVQAAARTARYDALAAHARAIGCDAIVTAHHRDDQAETFLMRASRGSGVGGLAGVRARGTWRGMPVLRPLLSCPRADLIAIVQGAGLTAIDDPSNADPAYDRTRVRALLAGSDALEAGGLARSAGALADAADALAWSAAELATTRIAADGGAVRLDARGLPDEYRRRLLTIAIKRAGGMVRRGSALDGVLSALDAGRRVSLADWTVVPDADGGWRITPAPPRRTR